jgi:hypothetical protein
METISKADLETAIVSNSRLLMQHPIQLKREHAIMKPTPITSKLQKIRASEFLNSNSLIQI